MISVIIPVFNGARHIATCYDSLAHQTYDNWEAIFIDDGSTDNTNYVLKELSKQDRRVKVIHKENEGVAVAREIGIQKAQGNFITFLDVDDTLVDDALALFSNHSDYDIIIGGMNMISEDGKLIKKINYKPRIMSGYDALEHMCTGSIRWQLCGKAFKANLFQSTITPKGLKSAEDMAVCLQASLSALNVILLNENLYNYIQVASSVTHSKAKEISYDALKAVEFTEKIIGSEINKTSLDCLYLLIISGALRAGIENNNKIFREAINKHGRYKAICKLPYLKAISLWIFKYLKINIATLL